MSAREAANDRASAASSVRVSAPAPALAEQEIAAPAAGVTGTIDLPDLPIPAGATVDAVRFEGTPGVRPVEVDNVVEPC